MTDGNASNSTSILLAQATPAVTTTHTTAAPPTGEGEAASTSQWPFFALSLGAFLIISLVAILGMRRLKMIPAGIQNTLEMLVESLYGIAEMVMGPRGRAYAPFVSTFFLYILVMNFMGLIPFLKSGTASLSITAGMGITAFLATQYFGFRAHGPKYLAHFMGPVWWMFFLILPLEILSELVRPVSLSFRLYGNIFGEEQVVSALATQLGQFGPLFAVMLLPLQLLTCVLQALVFTLLVTVYISLATEKHGDEHGEASEAH